MKTLNFANSVLNIGKYTLLEPSFKVLKTFLHINMAPRGRGGKFSKPTRGGMSCAPAEYEISES